MQYLTLTGLALATRAWTTVVGALVAYTIANQILPQLQGYYYLFNSLLLLQALGELGLVPIIVNLLSHESSNTRVTRDGLISNDSAARGRVWSMCFFVMRWFSLATIFIVVLLALVGLFFIGADQDGNVDIARIRLQWFVLLFFAAGNFFLNPIWSILEGLNELNNAYLGKFLVTVFSSSALFISIQFGLELWSLAIAQAVAFLLTLFLLLMKYKTFLTDIFTRDPNHAKRVNWRKDILPFQWRVGVSWISGYFSFSCVVPIIFYFKGAVMAGQFGLTMVIANTIVALSSSVLAPRTYIFGVLASAREFTRLDRVFFRTVILLLVLAIFFSMAAYFFVIFLIDLYPKLGSRLVSNESFKWLLFLGFCNSVAQPVGVYVRAHKEEPLFLLSVATGFLVLVSSSLTSLYCSEQTISAVYSLVIFFSGLSAWGMFFKFRASNHKRC